MLLLHLADAVAASMVGALAEQGVSAPTGPDPVIPRPDPAVTVADPVIPQPDPAVTEVAPSTKAVGPLRQCTGGAGRCSSDLR